MTCAGSADSNLSGSLSEPILLYIHVPFCRRKCGYCSFHSGPWSREAGKVYLESALAELDAWGARLDCPRVATVYMGGGTPSLLPESAFSRVREVLERRFRLEADLEWTVEGNPESADSVVFFQSLRSAGVNRVSLGMQSFNDRDLAMLGRLHTAEQAVRSIGAARDAGFDNIGLDLIWGLPEQSVEAWLLNLKRAVELGPEHMSCYGLSVDTGTPLKQAVQENRITLPADEDLELMFLEGTAFLTELGYLHYEISNFCRLGRESRHNSGYWAGRPYLGIGPAAVSCMGGKRWRNPEQLHSYAGGVAEGPVDVEELSRQDRINEMIILSLRTARGLSDETYYRFTGHGFEDGRKALIEAFMDRGLMRRTQAGWALTAKGMMVSNAVLSELLE